jgi:hypothetical protein
MYQRRPQLNLSGVAFDAREAGAALASGRRVCRFRYPMTRNDHASWNLHCHVH